jgi:glycosyltransferase involved in cell wall biosynthesis
MSAMAQLRVAVLIPCFNEALTVGKVVGDFRSALPLADIYVYDNNSRDGTAERAADAGAIVRHEALPGKGNVVRRMFADIDADVYLMVDGDDTYEAGDAPRLIRYLVDNNFDLVNGRRIAASYLAYRPGHAFGNTMLTSLVTGIFGRRLSDNLSGYKVFSRRFVKSFPALSSGFETETELAVHALELRMGIGELETVYRERPEGSVSKLRTIRDGIRILKTIVHIVKAERPLPFFTLLAGLLFVFSLSLGWPVVLEFMRTGLVPRLPTAVLAAATMVMSFLALVCGLVLDTVTQGRRETKRLHYLAIPGVAAASTTTERAHEAKRVV